MKLRRQDYRYIENRTDNELLTKLVQSTLEERNHPSFLIVEKREVDPSEAMAKHPL